MVPLVIHISSYLILLLAHSILSSFYPFWSFTARAGAISIGVMFLCTGIAHFTSTQGMIDMFPSFVPFKKELVYLSGVFEILAGVALILALGPQKLIAGLLILFLLISLPLNIYSAWANTGLGANGLTYLWFRIPLQIFWMFWIYYFVLGAKLKT